MTPNHYRHNIQVMELVAENHNITRTNAMLVGQAIKYLLRLGYKGSWQEDLDKAIDYLWRARHGQWLETGEQDTPAKQEMRIRNLFRLSNDWYTSEEVSELLCIPLEACYSMLGDLVDAAGYLERHPHPAGPPMYRRVDK